MGANRGIRLRVIGLGALTAVAALALSACSSDGASTGSRTNGAGNTVGSAPAGLASFSATSPPPEIPRLSGTPRKGVNMVVVQCNVPSCVQTFAPIKTGISKLGWNLKIITYDISGGPNALNTALRQGIKAKPDYMTWNSAFPYETQAKTVEAAKAAGIGLIPINGTMQPAFLNCLSCSKEFVGAGVTAMKIPQALEKNPNVGLVLQPDLKSQADEMAGMKKQAEAAGGSVSGINVSASNPAPVNNQIVVGYLRTHPQIKYVVTTVDVFGQGLPAALKQAGLDSKVKYIMNVMMPGGNDINLAKSGQATAGIAVELEMASYRVLDTAARDVLKEKIPADLVDPAGWQQVVTKDNASSLPASFQAKDYEQAFYKAWGIR
ncbi:sugar ABC transporter substrate-binding protein [Streptomyces brasiliensis]|uniref:Periplasmic binding protein domain-containing protein n=1 Tax=Streptomyces brasiliensis TaxID=1954 RepID=A0A917PCP8_9ACTN|nr:hypothetical protein [Streptomyces brasiliensis]GGJ71159.1 hypothetical protein GCM10010121_097180 [Streptomyces brasiliensis]